ncbi:hypothetical protein YC2023_051495 [Brassica napus]
MWKENGFSSLIMAAQDQDHDPRTLAKDVFPVLLSYRTPFAIYHPYLQKNNKSHDNEHFTASGDMYAQTSAREDGHQSANNRTIATRISDNISLAERWGSDIEMECLKCRKPGRSPGKPLVCSSHIFLPFKITRVANENRTAYSSYWDCPSDVTSSSPLMLGVAEPTNMPLSLLQTRNKYQLNVHGIYGIISNGSARTYEYLTNVKTIRDIGAVQSEIHTLLFRANITSVIGLHHASWCSSRCVKETKTCEVAAYLLLHLTSYPRNRHLRNDSRRRSLSFGNKPSESNLVWKEKTPPSVNNQINKPHSSPVVRHATITPEAQQQLHEEILSKLHDVTMKYVNVPDPVEREARRQQVLEGERHNLTAERAASLLA